MKNKVITMPLFDPLNESLKYKCIAVRKKLEIAKNVVSSSIRIYSNCLYVLYVNTQPVLRSLGVNDTDLRKIQEADITTFTRDGINAICVMLYSYTDEEPFVYIDGEIDTGDEKITVSSDESFKISVVEAYDEKAPKLAYFKNPVEVFDNSKYEENWLNCDFNDEKWKNATVKSDELSLRTEADKLSFTEEEYEGKLILAAGVGNEASDTLAVHQRIAAEMKDVKMSHVFVIGTSCEIKPLDKGSFSYILVDFEKVVSGFLKLDITGYKGDIVDVCFAKKLENERPVINSVARFILKDDENILETRFYDNTFRYVLLVFRNYVRKDVLNKVSAIQRTTSFVKEIENKELYEILKLNVKEKICKNQKQLSLKEQYLYTENLYREYGETTHLKNIIYDIGYHQLSDGRFVANYPHFKKIYDKDSMLFVNMLEKYTIYSEETETAKEFYNRVLCCLNYFTQKENKFGAIEEDGTILLDKNLCYVKMLESVKNLAGVLKQKETVEVLNKKIKKLKKYLKKEFYNQDIKVFSSEITNGVKNNIIDVDANILILDMLYKKGNKKTEIMMNNLTDKSIVSAEVISLSEDKITEFVSVCRKFKMEHLIKPELEKHKGDNLILAKALI